VSKKILVIDGDRPFASAISATLRARGLDATFCGDGPQGLERVRTDRPDVIVLCVELPRMSGYAICNKLKKDEQLRSIPLVITSAEATPETFEQHRKLRTRADDYLLKPFDAAALLKTIAGLVELPPAPVEAGHSEVIALGPQGTPGTGAGDGLDDEDARLIDEAFDQLETGGGGSVALESVRAPPRDAPAADPEVQRLRSRVAELVAELARVNDALRVALEESARPPRTDDALQRALAEARAAEERAQAADRRAAAAETRAAAAEQRLEQHQESREKTRRTLAAALKLLQDAPPLPAPGEMAPRRE
jgi:CheY-like chemotaxis protein